MTNCTRCGAPLPPQAHFCTACGAAVAAPSPAKPPAPAGAAQPSSTTPAPPANAVASAQGAAATPPQPGPPPAAPLPAPASSGTAPTPGTAPVPKPKKKRWPLVVVALLLVAALATAGVLLLPGLLQRGAGGPLALEAYIQQYNQRAYALYQQQPDGPWCIALNGKVHQLSAEALGVAAAYDGSAVVYTSEDEAYGIFQLDTASGETRQLTDDAVQHSYLPNVNQLFYLDSEGALYQQGNSSPLATDASQFATSSTGSHVAWLAAGALYLRPTAGKGATTTLAEELPEDNCRLLCTSADGSTVFYAEHTGSTNYNIVRLRRATDDAAWVNTQLAVGGTAGVALALNYDGTQLLVSHGKGLSLFAEDVEPLSLASERAEPLWMQRTLRLAEFDNQSLSVRQLLREDFSRFLCVSGGDAGSLTLLEMQNGKVETLVENALSVAQCDANGAFAYVDENGVLYQRLPGEGGYQDAEKVAESIYWCGYSSNGATLYYFQMESSVGGTRAGVYNRLAPDGGGGYVARGNYTGQEVLTENYFACLADYDPYTQTGTLQLVQFGDENTTLTTEGAMPPIAGAPGGAFYFLTPNSQGRGALYYSAGEKPTQLTDSASDLQ